MSFLTSRLPALRNTLSAPSSTTTSSTFTYFLRLPTRRGLARMTIIGRLADTPEITPTATGNDIIKYALATNSGPRDRKVTSWWKVALFAPPEGGLRDLVLGLGKGSLLCVEGDCSMNKFETKDGQQASSLNIVQKNMEILERRGGEEAGEEMRQAAAGSG